MYDIPIFEGEKAIHLKTEDYYLYLIYKIKNAKKNVLSSMFIVSPLGASDAVGRAKNVLDELVYANWRGVDTRLVVGKSSQRELINVGNETALEYLEKRGVPVKQYEYYNKSLHSKYVIIDDMITILGSANWTDNALARNNEDSIAVHSKDLTLRFKIRFEKIWEYDMEERG